mgnify:CR=1 FL=1
MGEETRFIQQNLHPDRKLITPLEVERGATFAIGSIISGAVASNNIPVASGGGLLYQVSSPVKVRMLGLEMFNREVGWIELELRDGGETGGRVLGPYSLGGRAGVSKSKDDLIGAYFTSSVHAVVLSGFAAQPLSNGIRVNLRFVLDPSDYDE